MIIYDEQLEKWKQDIFLAPLESAEELRDWVYVFFDIKLPLGHCDEDSNSSPVEAMWEIYEAVKNNTGDVVPEFTLLAARSTYKTLAASILQMVLMLHFRITMANAAAIESQSAKSVEYRNGFLNKIKKYLEAAGWSVVVNNTRRIELMTETGETTYIQLIILTLQGSNCISPESIISMPDGNFKVAKDIVAGDKILTWDYFQNKNVEVLVGSTSYTEKYSRELVFDNGSNLVLSDDHMVFTRKGWITSSSVRLNDKFKSTGVTGVVTPYEIKNDINPEDRDLDQVIMGTVLGDASIQILPSGNCRYTLFHCEAQLPYLQEIYKVFLHNGIECAITKIRRGYRLATKTNPIFVKYRELMYDKDKYKNPTKILNLLNYEGIAYWIMDDGHGNGRQIGKNKDHNFELATCGFTKEHNAVIIQFFNDLGYITRLDTVSNSTKKIYDMISMDLESSRKLSEKIKPYFVNCMLYKLLNSKEINNAQRTIDEDELVYKQVVDGFQWSSSVLRNKRFARKRIKTIREACNLGIREIKIIGKQKLIDIHVDSKVPYLHSFYANGILVHNSSHVNCLMVDEVDLCNPAAYTEAKMIPSFEKGRHRLTVRLSTRKFAFGLMEKEIQESPKRGGKVLRWNVLDITQYCPPEVCKPDEPKVERYIPHTLPLQNISPEEFNKMQDSEKLEFKRIDAFAGCVNCPLLSACKTRLHTHRTPDQVGDLWRPLVATIGDLKGVDADAGEAQLLCNKPSTKGLIYSRFNDENLLTVAKAWEMLTGLSNPNVTQDIFINYIKHLGIQIEAGVDWGYTNEFAIVVVALLTQKKTLVLETFAAPGLEPDECVKIAKELQQRYNITRFWADPAYPAYCKIFNNAGLVTPPFTKSVETGIISIRKQIVDAGNKRYLTVLDIPENERLIQMFKNYHWKLDGQGNPTTHPDHDEHSDVADAIRYLYQNKFGEKTKAKMYLTEEQKPNNTTEQIFNNVVNSNKNTRLTLSPLDIVGRPVDDDPSTSKRKKRIY